MRCSPGCLGVLFSLVAVLVRTTYFIITPLWLDYFKHQNSTALNITNSSTHHQPSYPLFPAFPIQHNINSFYVIFFQWFITSSFFGVLLLLMKIFRPDLITDAEKTFPKKVFFIIGFSQGISSILFNYALSGSRSPPYLQSLLTNFEIPIQFTIRFLILRKRPTRTRLICASVVLAAEFVCLLPTVFPGLESSSQHHREGGVQHGPGRVLWPLCLVLSQFPFALANTMMEKSMQAEGPQEGSNQNEAGRLNLVYFTFWWSFALTLTILAFFWVDLIPGFGNSNSFHTFIDTLIFDIKCQFGVSPCGLRVSILGWLNFICCVLASFCMGGLMKYSEGANYAIILMTLCTPVIFLFWTLFEEEPFQWRPHMALSTWLSIGALAVMLPAVIVYNLGEPDKVVMKPKDDSESLLINEDQEPNMKN